MQADVLAGLLRALELTPGGRHRRLGRVAGLAAGRATAIPTSPRALALWWISGGVFGLLSLASYYCAPSVPAAWNDGMDAVAVLPSWEEPLQRYAPNRDLLLAQDPREFIATMERWMEAYCACTGELVPGLPDDDARRLDLPALVFRSGAVRREPSTRHRRSSSPRCSRTPSSSNRRGPTPSGSTAARGLWAGLRTLAAPGPAAGRLGRGGAHPSTTVARRDLDDLRRRHRHVGTAIVLHADDAPRAAGEVDPGVEALAAVAAHDLGGTVGARRHRASTRGRSGGCR